MDDKDVDTITINVSDDFYIDVNDTMSAYSYSYNNIPTTNMTISSTGNVGIGATGSSGSFYTSTGFNGSSWMTASTNLTGTGLHVTSDAEFDGDLKVKGVSILETLQKIEGRLAILRPDPEKLEHFAALKKAYEHYKTLEALCEIPKEENKE